MFKNFFSFFFFNPMLLGIHTNNSCKFSRLFLTFRLNYYVPHPYQERTIQLLMSERANRAHFAFTLFFSVCFFIFFFFKFFLFFFWRRLFKHCVSCVWLFLRVCVCRWLWLWLVLLLLLLLFYLILLLYPTQNVNYFNAKCFYFSLVLDDALRTMTANYE